MRSLRLVTWNCHHGTLSTCLAELAEQSPDIVFLQECATTKAPPLVKQFFTRRIGPRKSIALGSRNADYHVAKLEPRLNSGQAVLAAAVTGPVSFTALGIWAQGPNYAADVMQTLDAYDDVLRSGPSVIMGDLNSGTPLGRNRPHRKGHQRILARLADLGLVSAYHAFHQVEHGHETHPTYRHLFKRSAPWHIDFCFIPESWVKSLVGMAVIDNQNWSMRSDHLPLKADFRFSRSFGQLRVISAPSAVPRETSRRVASPPITMQDVSGRRLAKRRTKR